jgi:hypothetical protein
MKTERLVLGLALVAAGVFGSATAQHHSLASGPGSSRDGSGIAQGTANTSNYGLGVGSGTGQSENEVQSKCTDGAYVRNGHRWSTQYNWYFQAASRPKGSLTYRVVDALRRAAVNIVRGDNNCGIPDLISATHSYRGTTSRAPNISSSAWCKGRDGRNVVGFGTLPSAYLGMTCWWTYGGKVVESDFILNKAHYAWFVNRPSGCRSKWSIEAAATHEFGHVFGLGHVSESSHPGLTMSPMIKACQSAETNLGLGDVLGLRSLY